MAPNPTQVKSFRLRPPRRTSDGLGNSMGLVMNYYVILWDYMTHISLTIFPCLLSVRRIFLSH